MATTNPNWGSWSSGITGLSAQSVNNAATATSTNEISNDDKIATEVSVACTYGATASQGLKVYVFGSIDGSTWENVASGAWGFEMQKATSTALYARFMVSALDYSSFKIHVTNNTGATVTVTVKTRQATFDTV